MMTETKPAPAQSPIVVGDQGQLGPRPGLNGQAQRLWRELQEHNRKSIHQRVLVSRGEPGTAENPDPRPGDAPFTFQVYHPLNVLRGTEGERRWAWVGLLELHLAHGGSCNTSQIAAGIYHLRQLRHDSSWLSRFGRYESVMAASVEAYLKFFNAIQEQNKKTNRGGVSGWYDWPKPKWSSKIGLGYHGPCFDGSILCLSHGLRPKAIKEDRKVNPYGVFHREMARIEKRFWKIFDEDVGAPERKVRKGKRGAAPRKGRR